MVKLGGMGLAVIGNAVANSGAACARCGADRRSVAGPCIDG
jgi:hypothetical protein